MIEVVDDVEVSERKSLFLVYTPTHTIRAAVEAGQAAEPLPIQTLLNNLLLACTPVPSRGHHERSLHARFTADAVHHPRPRPARELPSTTFEPEPQRRRAEQREEWPDELTCSTGEWSGYDRAEWTDRRESRCTATHGRGLRRHGEEGARRSQQRQSREVSRRTPSARPALASLLSLDIVHARLT